MIIYLSQLPGKYGIDVLLKVSMVHRQKNTDLPVCVVKLFAKHNRILIFDHT